ncbi:MAG: serine/threonine protein kinase [Blastocatellia bacterium]|nr:serine/threonine protein kinase [Blastocatellia bacterium]
MIPPNTILNNRYQIVKLLAKGGMGAVYEAFDQRLGNIRVAVKETLTTSDRLREAFEQEAILLAKLRHSGLPRVIDHFTSDEGQFLVMEFIEGEDLGEELKSSSRKFRLEDVLSWAEQALETLHYLHTFQPPIIHRDIKPTNIKLTSQGQLVLLDFGLAKDKDESLVSGYTANYAAPEQITGEGTDPRSDLYSLAATLYHLLAGSSPADAMKRMVASTREGPDPLIPLYKINPEVPESISGILKKAMALDRKDRFQNAAEMLAQIKRATRREQNPMETAVIDPAQTTSFAKEHRTRGARVEEKPNTKTDTVEQVSASSNSGSRTILIATLVVVAVAVGLLGYSYFGSEKNGKEATSSTATPPQVSAPPTTSTSSTKTGQEVEVFAPKPMQLEYYLVTENGKQLTGSPLGGLKEGEKFKFRIKSTEFGYLYITTPQQTLLTEQPTKEAGLQSNIVEAGTELEFPLKGWLRRSRISTYFLILSKKPVVTLSFLSEPGYRLLSLEQQADLEKFAGDWIAKNSTSTNLTESSSGAKVTKVSGDQVDGVFLFKLSME